MFIVLTIEQETLVTRHETDYFVHSVKIQNNTSHETRHSKMDDGLFIDVKSSFVSFFCCREWHFFKFLRRSVSIKDMKGYVCREFCKNFIKREKKLLSDDGLFLFCPDILNDRQK